MNCLCGCGAEVREGRSFVMGHHLRGEHKPQVPTGSDHYAWRRETHPEERGYVTGCQIYGIKPRPDGYVRIQTPQGSRYAHRWTWECEHGPIPAPMADYRLLNDRFIFFTLD